MCWWGRSFRQVGLGVCRNKKRPDAGVLKRLWRYDGDMRTLVAIIAAAMSITTGGPLRCPCQLVKHCLASALPTPSATTLPAPPPAHRCGCQSHASDDQQLPDKSAPDDRRPQDESPCQHSPGADLAAPPSAERQIGSFAADILVSAPVCPVDLAPSSSQAGLAPGILNTGPASRAFLRYAHSFRC